MCTVLEIWSTENVQLFLWYMKRISNLCFQYFLQVFQGIFVRLILTNAQAPHARTEPNVPMDPTSTRVTVLKVCQTKLSSNVIFIPFVLQLLTLSSCWSGYTGQHCEIDINECYSDPCHYGTCKDGLASFTCYCRPGYTGRLCETNINECLSQPCKNGGTCQDRENSYICSCPKGTAGEASATPTWLCE